MVILSSAGGRGCGRSGDHDRFSCREVTMPEELHDVLQRAMKDGRSWPLPPIAKHIGFTMTAIAPGRATMEMDADERLANPMGTLHGGVLCDLADAAMGMAYASELERGESFTTLELKINFMKP